MQICFIKPNPTYVNGIGDVATSNEIQLCLEKALAKVNVFINTKNTAQKTCSSHKGPKVPKVRHLDLGARDNLA